MNRVRAFAACVVAAGAVAGQAMAQEFPSRPITVIVPFPPGGIADTIGRPTAAALEKVFKQPVVITNRAGAAGAVGFAAGANARPDGYTIVTAITSVSTIPEADKLFGRTPAYSLDRLAPIALVAADPLFLVVHSSLPARTVKEFVALAKTKPNHVSYTSSGVYGALHVPMEMFAQAAGLKMRHIPTTGGGPALTTLLGGHAEASTGGPSALEPHIKAGRIRPLASFGAARYPGLKDVPTFKELGQDIEYYLWMGLMAPVGLPEPVAKAWRDAVRRVMGDADFQLGMQRINSVPHHLDAPEFQKFLDADARRMAAVVRGIGRVEDKK